MIFHIQISYSPNLPTLLSSNTIYPVAQKGTHTHTHTHTRSLFKSYEYHPHSIYHQILKNQPPKCILTPSTSLYLHTTALNQTIIFFHEDQYSKQSPNYQLEVSLPAFILSPIKSSFSEQPK